MGGNEWLATCWFGLAMARVLVYICPTLPYNPIPLKALEFTKLRNASAANPLEKLLPRPPRPRQA